MQKRVCFPGARFARLTVLSCARKVIVCRCDCGGEITVNSSNLRAGRTRSCGCLKRESDLANGIRKRGVAVTFKHGAAKRSGATRTYRSWVMLRRRCMDPSARGYENYGGRGITVCDEWRGSDSFPRFLADMGEAPAGCSIERKNNDGPYCKANCKWATPAEQNRNRRNNHRLTLNGQSKIMEDWAREIGISARTISARIGRLGWSVERALTEPLHGS